MQMRVLLIPAVTGALLASSALAFALQATGTVKTYNAKSHTVILHDGTKYLLPKTSTRLKAGEKVQISIPRMARGGAWPSGLSSISCVL